jgi:hypothetical protein
LLLFCIVSLLYFVYFLFIKNTKNSSDYSCYFCWSVIVLLYHAFYQWLVPLKPDLIGKVGSRKNNKNIMRNTACHKKGNTYGNKLINCISLLEPCALLIMLLIALINLVAVGGINTSLFNVSIMIMIAYLLMLREIMTFMMWNKLKNLLLGRVHSNLHICLKILMMHLINMRFMI